MKKYLILMGVFVALAACAKQDNRLRATMNMPEEYKTSKDYILEIPPQLRDKKK